MPGSSSCCDAISVVAWSDPETRVTQQGWIFPTGWGSNSTLHVVRTEFCPISIPLSHSPTLPKSSMLSGQAGRLDWMLDWNPRWVPHLPWLSIPASGHLLGEAWDATRKELGTGRQDEQGFQSWSYCPLQGGGRVSRSTAGTPGPKAAWAGVSTALERPA